MTAPGEDTSDTTTKRRARGGASDDEGANEAQQNGPSAGTRTSTDPTSPSDAGSTARGGPPVIERAFLESGVRTLSSRERGSDAGRAAARAFLSAQYKSLGFAVREEPFAGGVNFVAEKPGSDGSKYLVISAHYDSVSNAGADDDGTGVISSLAIARALQGKQTRIGLRFVAFDLEEDGLRGSAAYVSARSAEGALGAIVGDVNLEMTGYDAQKTGRFHAMHCNRATSMPLAARVVSAAADAKDLALTLTDACTDRSDHASFWEAGVPAIVVGEAFFATGGANPCYHKACDTIDNVDFDYMRRLTQATAVAVLASVQ